MNVSSPDTDQLIDQVRQGNCDAGNELLARHRGRLRRMVAVRLDQRLVPRVDPSDVVQEVMAEAAEKLNQYVAERPIAFYPWLRQIAWQRLTKLHEHHVLARKRSTLQEQPWDQALPDESAMLLVGRIVAPDTSPTHHAVRKEMRDRVQAALTELSPRDREVLVMRYLEQLSMKEIAGVVRQSESAVKTRHFRALNRLRALLDTASQGDGP